MNNLPEFVNKYLKKYSFDKWNLEINQDKLFKNIIVIPAIKEFNNLKRLLNSLLNNDHKYFNSTLIIFVINNLKSSSKEIKSENKKSIELIRDLIKSKSKLNFGLVNASTEKLEMPEKVGGVGFARKIGMDLSLKYFDYKTDRKNILICLDADCTLQNNYLTEIVNNFNNRNLSAAVVNYKHKTDNAKTSTAIICYEIFLRYYVLGLKLANSPYAIHTVGSTMTIDVESYIKVEGMNKRKAAEDFYFIEKLAKNVKVQSINSTTVFPSSRGSWRVPFGTGQRINRFLSQTQNEYLLYNPDSFAILKNWLSTFGDSNFEKVEFILNKAKDIDASLYKFLLNQNFEKQWNKILDHTKDETQLYKQKQRWFDGFRTLKLIHFLRDNGYPMINMFEALDEIFSKFKIKMEREKDIPEIPLQIKYLETLRKLT